MADPQVVIDRTRKVLFLHVPKTGGSSVEVMLLGADEVGEHRQLDQELLSRADLAPFFPLARHATLTDYERLLEGEGEALESYKVFVLLRHPEDVLKSTYRFRLSNFELRRAGLSRTQRVSFAMQHRTFPVFLLTQALRAMIGKPGPKTLAMFEASKARVPVVRFRLEDLAKDASPLLDYLELSGEAQLQRKNVGVRDGDPLNARLLPAAARIIFPEMSAVYRSVTDHDEGEMPRSGT